MKDLLIETLSQLNYPIFLQGSMGCDEIYPDSFFTFWNNDTYANAFYDNEEKSCVWDFDLNFYSIDPKLVNQVLLQAKVLLKKAGFIINGKGYDVASDEASHTGRGINLFKIEK